MQICIIFFTDSDYLQWLVQQHRKSLEQLELAFSDHKPSQTIMLPQKQYWEIQKYVLEIDLSFPFTKKIKHSILITGRGWEKSYVWNSCEAWRVSQAQAEIHSETEMEGEGRRDSMGEESSKAVELLWSNKWKSLERVFVAPFFVPPCGTHININ